MRISGPGATTFTLSVTEQRKVALEQILRVDALDYLADAEILETPGVQSRVHLRGGTTLLCTNAPGELSRAFSMAYPHLILGPLKGGGCQPHWPDHE